MFKTGIFRDTRAGTGAGRMDIANFPGQFSLSPVIENYDLDKWNRDALMNYGPDPILFESDLPRYNTMAKERLNLRHYGAFVPDMPYMSEDYDTQEHKKDPRGCAGEIPWRRFHELDYAKAKQRIFHSDADNSVPSQGISYEDMRNKISNLRSIIKYHMPWFSESLGTIAAGKIGHVGNTPHSASMIVNEVDPYAFDITTNKNLNRYNEGNLGGQYFINRQTTDHIMPTSSYNLLFKTAVPDTPADLVKMAHLSQAPAKLSVLGRNVGTPNSIDVTNKTDYSYQKKASNVIKNKRVLELLENNKNEVLREKSKYSQHLFLQDNPRKKIEYDVVSLMGLTTHDVKWVNSQKNVNKQVYDAAVQNLAELMSMMDGVPTAKLIEIRNRLLAVKEHAGGSTQTVMPIAVKRLLVSRNKAVVGKQGRGEVDMVIKSTRSLLGRNKAINGNLKRANAEMEKVETYNRVFTSKQMLGKITNQLQGTADFVSDSDVIKPRQRVVNYERSDAPVLDNDKGVERYMNRKLQSFHENKNRYLTN